MPNNACLYKALYTKVGYRLGFISNQTVHDKKILLDFESMSLYMQSTQSSCDDGKI